MLLGECIQSIMNENNNGTCTGHIQNDFDWIEIMKAAGKQYFFIWYIKAFNFKNWFILIFQKGVSNVMNIGVSIYK